jgi:hypothetical protein
MAEELDQFVAALEVIHPAPYTKMAKDEFAAEVSALKKSLSASLTAPQFEKRLAVLVARLKDSPTAIMPKLTLEECRQSQHKLLPFAVHEEQGHLKIAAVMGAAEGPSVMTPGMIITKIQDVPIEQFMSSLQQYVAAEDSVLTRERVVADFTFYSYLHLGSLDEFSIQTDQGTFKVRGRTLNELNELLPQTVVPRVTPYEFKVQGDPQLGIIRFDSFDNAKAQAAMKFIDESFAQLKQQGVTRLIIDIKDNRGGSAELSGYLMSYLTAAKFGDADQFKLKISQPILDFYGMDEAQGLYPGMERMKIGEIYTYTFSDEQKINLASDYPQIADNRFAGSTVLITGSNSYGAAVSFAANFRKLKLGTIVGGQTGGAVNTSGEAWQLTLKHSAVAVNITFKQYIGIPDYTNGAGLTPDVAVSAKDALAKAREILQQPSL